MRDQKPAHESIGEASVGGTGFPLKRISLKEGTRFHLPSNQYLCPAYEPLPDSKRCKHYLPNGACSLPTELMCVEWLKANGHPAPAAGRLPRPREPFRLQVQVQAPAPTARTALKAGPPAAVSPAPVDEVRPTPVPTSDIEALKALGLEVELDVGGTRVSLVPEYTRQSRIELSLEHAATLRLLLDSFPDARVLRLERETASPSPSLDQEVRDEHRQ